jgi:formamidopyrimidine-DNA glycosylase
MPELPDVEYLRKYMNSTSLHKKIVGVEVKNSKIIGRVSPAALKKQLKGNKLKVTKRHGKNLFAGLANKKWLTMHFGMTGYLKYFKNEEDAPRHARLLINFDNGYRLAYDSMRMLGRIDLVDDLSMFIKRKKLGVDPVEDKLSFKEFIELFNGRNGLIKTGLMNQSIIAGIGNIYADEILFHADIHPESNIKKLNEDDFKKIYQKMNSVLKKAIAANADHKELPADYLLRHRKAGEDCPVCAGKIMKQTIGGRSSYFCSRHQKKR